MKKKLYRVKEGKYLAGVCGGIAEYFDMDPTLIRLPWALIACFAGAGIIAYIVCAFVIPEKEDDNTDVD